VTGYLPHPPRSIACWHGGSLLPLQLVAVRELPGVRAALAQLVASPSLAGPGGWDVGWHMPKATAADAVSIASHVAILKPLHPEDSATLEASAADKGSKVLCSRYPCRPF
jgi:hypothetical protein